MTANHTNYNQKQPEVSTFCNLTEQWKKGELESGWYYITTSFTDEALREYFDGNEFRTVFTCNVKEVLAPVPSYEEWKSTGKFAMEAMKVAEENQQLKEMLYKYREKLDELDYGCEVWQGELTGFIEEIDNAIGEKK